MILQRQEYIKFRNANYYLTQHHLVITGFNFESESNCTNIETENKLAIEGCSP